MTHNRAMNQWNRIGSDRIGSDRIGSDRWNKGQNVDKKEINALIGATGGRGLFPIQLARDGATGVYWEMSNHCLSSLSSALGGLNLRWVMF